MPMPPLLVLIAALLAQADPESRSRNQPVEPFRIAGNIYYVGANEITSFLFATAQGHIVLDGGFVETAPQILANIRRLGFRPEDVRVLLSSHAHLDHAGGLAALKKATGASLQVMEGDAVQIENGGRNDFAFGDRLLFPAARVDRVLHDGEVVALGGTRLVAHRTAGHTKGCTTWTTTADGHPVVFLCSTTAPGYKLKDNAAYPNIVEDFRQTFRALAALPCDIFLGSHGSFFHLEEKRKTKNFVDPKGYRDFIERTRRDFEKRLE